MRKTLEAGHVWILRALCVVVRNLEWKASANSMQGMTGWVMDVLIKMRTWVPREGEGRPLIADFW